MSDGRDQNGDAEPFGYLLEWLREDEPANIDWNEVREETTREPMNDNVNILAAVEEKGGGYVWDAEVFAVTFFNVPVSDEDALALCKLVGVQQIAIEASGLSFQTLNHLARIPGLQSLVLNHASLTSQELNTLGAIGPEVVLVTE